MELLDLIEVLMSDSRSRMAARVAGWSHPVSREVLTLMDLYDLQHASKSKRRPPPYPRPWPSGNSSRRGQARSVAELRALLDANWVEKT